MIRLIVICKRGECLIFFFFFFCITIFFLHCLFLRHLYQSNDVFFEFWIVLVFIDYFAEILTQRRYAICSLQSTFNLLRKLNVSKKVKNNARWLNSLNANSIMTVSR